MLNILFAGDIVGEDGLQLALDLIPRIKHDFKIDFCIVNGENIHQGKGITATSAKKLRQIGVDAITTGNHVWQKESEKILTDQKLRILRPANYPEENAGLGYGIWQSGQGTSVAVVNLQGRSFMSPIDCPFRKADEILSHVRKEAMVIVVDFHGEATAEKQALGWYLDGKVSAVLGTHTHVQTADERILPQGTAFITDAGMTGPFDSVIGMKTDTAIKRFLTQTPHYYQIAKNNVRFNGIVVKVDQNTGKANQIQRLNFSKADYGKRKNP